MAEINDSDLLIILKAATKMSHIDASIAQQEKAFLKKLLKINNLGVSNLMELRDSVDEDMVALSQRLSSKVAKKAFLLTLAAMALADEELEDSETRLLEKMSRELDVGQVKLSELSFKSCESMVLKLLRQVGGEPESDKKKEKLSHTQLSDFDLI